MDEEDGVINRRTKNKIANKRKTDRSLLRGESIDDLDS